MDVDDITSNPAGKMLLMEQDVLVKIFETLQRLTSRLEQLQKQVDGAVPPTQSIPTVEDMYKPSGPSKKRRTARTTVMNRFLVWSAHISLSS